MHYWFKLRVKGKFGWLTKASVVHSLRLYCHFGAEYFKKKAENTLFYFFRVKLVELNVCIKCLKYYETSKFPTTSINNSKSKKVPAKLPHQAVLQANAPEISDRRHKNDLDNPAAPDAREKEAQGSEKRYPAQGRDCNRLVKI